MEVVWASFLNLVAGLSLILWSIDFVRNRFDETKLFFSIYMASLGAWGVLLFLLTNTPPEHEDRAETCALLVSVSIAFFITSLALFTRSLQKPISPHEIFLLSFPGAATIAISLLYPPPVHYHSNISGWHFDLHSGSFTTVAGSMFIITMGAYSFFSLLISYSRVTKKELKKKMVVVVGSIAAVFFLSAMMVVVYTFVHPQGPYLGPFGAFMASIPLMYVLRNNGKNGNQRC